MRQWVTVIRKVSIMMEWWTLVHSEGTVDQCDRTIEHSEREWENKSLGCVVDYCDKIIVHCNVRLHHCYETVKNSMKQCQWLDNGSQLLDNLKLHWDNGQLIWYNRELWCKSELFWCRGDPLWEGIVQLTTVTVENYDGTVNLCLMSTEFCYETVGYFYRG